MTAVARTAADAAPGHCFSDRGRPLRAPRSAELLLTSFAAIGRAGAAAGGEEVRAGVARAAGGRWLARSQRRGA